MKVDFMIVGAQKCGTSTIFDILNAHPDLVGSVKKEPHFFSTSKNWRAELNRYHSLFSRKEGALYFEGSTTYTFYPLRNLAIWDDIYQYNPKMKFIYAVRNPLERVVSSYMHTYERGYTALSLEDALVSDRMYIDVSRYYTQIMPYIEKFGRKNVLLVDFEEMNSDRKFVLGELAEFLGVDANGFVGYENLRSNASVGGNKTHHKYDKPNIFYKSLRMVAPSVWEAIISNRSRSFSSKPVLPEDLRRMVVNMLRADNVGLEKLTGKSYDDWMI